MAHYPRPFFRSPRNRWYIQLGGKQINLGPDKDEAFRKYHELMAGHAKKPNGQPAVAPCPQPLAVVTVLDLYLDWCQKHRAPLTYEWYQERLQWFTKSIPRGLSVAELKPYHLQQWADGHDHWSDSHKRGCITAVQRAFNWAEKMGHLDRSPVRHVEKPQAGRRERIVTSAEFAAMLEHYRDAA